MIMQRFMEIINYRITSGSAFNWKCFGPNSYCFDGTDSNNYNISINFDTKTQDVYQLEVCDYRNDRAYRWTNSDYRQAHDEEAKTQAFSPGREDQAWDDVNYVSVETVDEFFEKATAIVQGQDYDERVSITIELPNDLVFELMKKAHELDITFNQLVEKILREAIDADSDFKESLLEENERI
jgi:hypothetical protein